MSGGKQQKPADQPTLQQKESEAPLLQSKQQHPLSSPGNTRERPRLAAFTQTQVLPES